MGPDGKAAGGVDRVNGLGDGGGLAQAEGGAALDEVGADGGADVVDPLVGQALGVGGVAKEGFGEMGPADRKALLPAGLDLAVVELEAELAQAVGHPQGAVLAIGEEAGEGGLEGGAGVVDEVAEYVKFASFGVVDGGDLDGGDDGDAGMEAGVDRLLDTADGVVIGEGEELDPGVGCALNYLGGGEGAVGVCGMGL